MTNKTKADGAGGSSPEPRGSRDGEDITAPVAARDRRIQAVQSLLSDLLLGAHGSITVRRKERRDTSILRGETVYRERVIVSYESEFGRIEETSLPPDATDAEIIEAARRLIR